MPYPSIPLQACESETVAGIDAQNVEDPEVARHGVLHIYFSLILFSVLSLVSGVPTRRRDAKKKAARKQPFGTCNAISD